MSLKRSLFYNLGSSGGVLLFGLVNSVLSTRVLGEIGKGQFAIYVAAIEVGVVLLMLGMNLALQYFSARDEFKGSRPLNTAIAQTAIAAVLFGLAVQLLFFFDKGSLALPAPFNGPLYQGLIVLHFFNQLFGYFIISLLNSYKEFVISSKIAFSAIFGTTLIYLGLFVASEFMDVPVLVNAYYITAATVAGLRLIAGVVVFRQFVLKKHGGWKLQFLSASQMRTFFLFGLYPWLSYFMIRAVFKLDFWFLEAYHGLDQVGLYSLASNVGEMIYLVPNSLGIVVFSYIADKETRDHSTLRTAFLARIFLFVMAIGAAVFSLFSGEAIAAVYGDGFYPSGQMLNLLMFGIVPFSLANLLQGYLSGANMVKQIFYSSAIGFTITIIGDWMFVPAYGTTGAALTTVTAYCTMTVYLVWCFRQASGLRYRDFLLPKREDLNMIKRLGRK